MRKLLVLFAMFISLPAFSQRILSTVADEVCECLKTKMAEGYQDTPDRLLTKCFEPSLAKHQIKIEKQMGVNFLNPNDQEKLQQLGVDVALKMASDCPEYMDMFAANKNEEGVLATDYFNKAEQFYGEGNNLKAIELYSKAIEHDPKKADYYNSRGVAYFAEGEYYRAISDFIRASDISPGFYKAFYNLAYTKYLKYDYYEALDDVHKSLEINNDYCEAHNLAGLLFNKLEMYDTAFYYFSNASFCDTSNATYVFNSGYMQYTLGEYEEALPYLLKAKELGHEDVNLNSYIGNSYNNLAEYEKAIAYHTYQIEGHNEDYVGFYNRGLSHFNMGNMQETLNDMLQAAQRDSTDADIHFYIGMANAKSGKFEDAIAHLSKAIELDNTNADFYDKRAEAYTNAHKYEEAIQDYRVSLSLYPDDCKVYQFIAENYRKLNMDEQASEAQEKSIELGCE